MFSVNVDSLNLIIDISQEELDKQLRDFNKKRSFRKYHGFNTSADKSKSDQNKYFMTDYLAEYKTVKNSRTGRNNKKPVYKPLFDSLHQAFQAASCQRQVFTGLNHTRRDLLVVDFDDRECFSIAAQQQAIQDIINMCCNTEIPSPSYIEFHNDSGHYQAGWYLEEYFINYNKDATRTAEYKYLTRCMAEIFNGDRSFKGGNIKNPFHDRNTAYFFNTDKIDAKLLLSKVESICSSLEKLETITGHTSFSPYPMEINNLYYFGTPVEESRNCYAYRETIKWTFVYMRMHNGCLPPQSEIEDMFELYEIDSLQFNGKTTIEDSTTIRRSAEGVAAFCNKHYDKQKAEMYATGDIASKRRDKSLIVRQANKAINYFKIKFLKDNYNLTQSEIARKIACSQATVHNILQTSQDDYIDCLKKYLDSYKNCPDLSKKKTLEYIEFIFKNLRFPKKYPLDKIFPELVEN